MMPEMQYSYETAGNSSYLVATFEEGRGLINYQLQMLVNNDIKNLVSAAKKQKNDDIQIFYNITSKITLEQATEKSKITKEGIIAIITGALATLKDLEEYQLVSAGVVFDADKIFVKPGHFEPNFIYVPSTTEDTGIQSLKNLLLNFVMGSKIEVSNDNFVQVLLETLNKPGFGASALKKMCDRYLSGGRVSLPEKREIKADTRISAQEKPPLAAEPRQEPPVPAPIPEPNRPSMPPDVITPPRPVPPRPIPADKKEEKVPEKKETKDKNPKKTAFLILQIALLAVVVGLSFTGILNDEEGRISLQYLGGIILGVGCVDFVVYREMFKNNKEKPAKKEEKTISKPAKKPAVAVPGKGAPAMPKPVSPTPKSVSPLTKKPAAVPGKAPQSPAVQPEVKAVLPTVKQDIPPAAVVPPIPQSAAYDPLSEFENEDTVVIEGNGTGGAYLEFYDNGIASRINLNRDRVVVGKLRAQCDFTLNNRKISKMHAEFVARSGQYFVKDFNSTNGTYINGSSQRIQSNQEYQIFNGDRITLADVDMTLFC